MTAERIIGALLGLFAGVFALVRSKWSAAFDLAMTIKLQAAQSPPLAALMRAASWPGFPPQSRLIPPLIIAGWSARGHKRSAIFQLLAWGGATYGSVEAYLTGPAAVAPATLDALRAHLLEP